MSPLNVKLIRHLMLLHIMPLLKPLEMTGTLHFSFRRALAFKEEAREQAGKIRQAKREEEKRVAR